MQWVRPIIDISHKDMILYDIKWDDDLLDTPNAGRVHRVVCVRWHRPDVTRIAQNETEHMLFGLEPKILM